MAKETELELEIQQCSEMTFNLEHLKEFLWIDLGLSDATKIKISDIRLRSEKDIICEHTGEPCALYREPEDVHCLRYINYHLLKRCPLYKDSVKKYKLKGIKSGPVFRASNMEELKNK